MSSVILPKPRYSSYLKIHVAISLGLTAKSKIIGNPKAHTQYITIPAVLAQDSAYPFKEDDEVQLEIMPKKAGTERETEKGFLIVRPAKSSASKNK